MPTISSSLLQPLVTPSTALLTRARTSPCTAARSSFSRVTWMLPSAACSFTPAGRCVCTWPFGPWTVTVLPFTSNFTPCGSGIGLFPMRDIVEILFLVSPSKAQGFEFHNRFFAGLWYLAIGPWQNLVARSFCGQRNCVRRNAQPNTTYQWPRARGSAALPHFTKHFSAHTLFARLAAGHHSLGSGQDVDAQTAQHPGDFIPADVHTAAGAGDALQVRDRSGIVRSVLQINPQNLPALFFRRLEIGDVTFFFQNTCDLLLQPRSRYIEFLVTRVYGVADARQQICDRIGQTHLRSSHLIVTRLPRSCGEPARDVKPST